MSIRRDIDRIAAPITEFENEVTRVPRRGCVITSSLRQHRQQHVGSSFHNTLRGRFPIFSMTEKDLRGFDEFPDNGAIDSPLPQLCRDGKHFGIADLITFARSK